MARWKDNAVVTIATNFDKVTPVALAKRWDAKEKKYVNVPQPALISNYNKKMGGVDILDKLLSSYRPKLRNRKWYWNLFTNALNIAVVAAFRISQLANQNPRYTHLQYRRDLAQALTGGFNCRERRGGPTWKITDEVRVQPGHFTGPTTQGRCVQCSKNTTKECVKCRKRLHDKCMEIFHTKTR